MAKERQESWETSTKSRYERVVPSPTFINRKSALISYTYISFNVYVEQCPIESIFRDFSILYLYILVLFHVLVILQVPVLAFGVGAGVYKQGEEESLH